MSFVFSYREMLDGYANNLNNKTFFGDDQNLVCYTISKTEKFESACEKQRQYESNKKLLKGQGYLGAYVKHYVDPQNIRKLKFVDDDSRHPNGLFVIMDTKTNNMYFVFPTLQRDNKSQEIITGDHYSFMYDKDDANGIHIDYNHYLPFEFDVNKGSARQIRLSISDNMLLPVSGYNDDALHEMDVEDSFDVEFDKYFGQMSLRDFVMGFNKDILDLCRFHHDKNHQITHDTRHEKSGKTRYARHTCGDISKTLEQILLKREITYVFAIGYKHDQKWHMTVNFKWMDDEHEEKNLLNIHYSVAFILNNPKFASFQSELTRILAR